MKFMIMTFGERDALHAQPPDWAERMAAILVRLDDELAQSGELVYSEVLDEADAATLVAPVGAAKSKAVGPSLSRFWVVKVASESRAIEIASNVSNATDAVVEIRRCMEKQWRP